MKLSISVPDELWAQVHDANNGPSDTVQRGLRSLANELRKADRPLANAPDQKNLDQYRPAFDAAVDTAVSNIRDVIGRGYRLGLLLAPGMAGADFDDLESPTAASAVSELLKSWAEDLDGLFSVEFADHAQAVLNAYHDDSDADPEVSRVIRELLGDDDGALGVRWEHHPADEGMLLPTISPTFADGILLALRDVRDEAVRRLANESSTDGQK